MTALLVSPDFASHYLPLAALGTALRERGHDVVVATGPGLRHRVLADGFDHAALVLGAGRNPGLARSDDQPDGERENLNGFLAATREGMVATLAYQARRRLHDLLWEPEHVAERLGAIVEELDPELVVSDQLAFGASLALRALDRPFASLLPGHPCQLPPSGEPFGFPTRLPEGIDADPDELAGLHELCVRTASEATERFNETLLRLSPGAAPVGDVFSAGSPWLTLVNYPAGLSPPRRFPPRTVLLGSCVRREAGDAELDALDRNGSPPRAYVALGSFLSARVDVLARVAEALRRLGLDAIVATGVADPAALGRTPSSWILRPHLPQVAALRACDVVVCHGGNNTVVEALTAGLPVLALPFSTDQFAGAADLEAAGLGAAVDPNRASPDEIASRLRDLLGPGPRDRAAGLGRLLRDEPGARRGARLVERALGRLRGRSGVVAHPARGR